MTSAERVAARSYLHEFLLADPFPSDEEAEATLGDALDDEDRAVLALMRVAWFEPDASGETDGSVIFADRSRLVRSDPEGGYARYAMIA